MFVGSERSESHIVGAAKLRRSALRGRRRDCNSPAESWGFFLLCKEKRQPKDGCHEAGTVDDHLSTVQEQTGEQCVNWGREYFQLKFDPKEIQGNYLLRTIC
uniref:Uncharacterized protein n=1 Tax=Micrurus surinamensis TaxID=129470 RepID=A0A2D4NY63_MICSU